MSSKPKCWFILFFIFPSMKVTNSIRLCYYSLRGGSLYKCEFWQAAKCSCMTAPWAETYWYLGAYSRCHICKAQWIICMVSACQACAWMSCTNATYSKSRIDLHWKYREWLAESCRMSLTYLISLVHVRQKTWILDFCLSFSSWMPLAFVLMSESLTVSSSFFLPQLVFC